jgi:hypothetical protein
MTLRDMPGRTRFPPVEFLLDVGLGKLQPGGATVDDAAIGRPVTLAE